MSHQRLRLDQSPAGVSADGDGRLLRCLASTVQFGYFSLKHRQTIARDHLTISGFWNFGCSEQPHPHRLEEAIAVGP